MEPVHDENANFQAKGHPDLPDIPLTDIQREKNRQLFQRGLKCLGAGVFLMSMSFGINLLFSNSFQGFAITMYTLTSVGAILILLGLGYILGF